MENTPVENTPTTQRSGSVLTRIKSLVTDAFADGDDAETDRKFLGEGDVTVPINPRPIIIAGLVVVGVIFGGFGTWAATAPLNSAVIAEGIVKVFSSRKKIQHLEGGIVEEVLVSNGDRVKAGDVLIRLDETRARADFLRVQGQYDQTRATVARLIAERDGLEDIPFPEDFLARMDEPSVAEMVDGQRKLFAARQETLFGQVSMIEERVKQLEEEVRGLGAQERSKKEQLALIEDELEGLRELNKKGWAPKTRILSLERAQAQLRGDQGDNVARIAQARVMMGEAELQALQARNDYQEKVVSELRQRQTEMYDLAETLDKAEFTLKHIEIRAGYDGVVVDKKVSSAGQVIRPGDTLMELVPDNDKLIIEAKVRPSDVDNVTQGLNADVQFSAFSQRTSPRLHGEVAYVSADALVDERSGMPYFTARVTVPESEVDRLGEENRLQPGMPAEVFIQTGAQTPLGYLMQPITDSMSRAWRES